MLLLVLCWLRVVAGTAYPPETRSVVAHSQIGVPKMVSLCPVVMGSTAPWSVVVVDVVVEVVVEEVVEVVEVEVVVVE